MIKLTFLANREMLLVFSILLLWLVIGLPDTSQAGDCGNINFKHVPSDYYGFGDYFMSCPDDAISIRCYHYHRHWVCEKGDILFWDRRLESAARMACGCDLPPDTAPASPATSGKPAKKIIGLDTIDEHREDN
jgi:hypothetical protein